MVSVSFGRSPWIASREAIKVFRRLLWTPLDVPYITRLCFNYFPAKNRREEDAFCIDSSVPQRIPLLPGLKFIRGSCYIVKLLNWNVMEERLLLLRPHLFFYHYLPLTVNSSPPSLFTLT